MFFHSGSNSVPRRANTFRRLGSAYWPLPGCTLTTKAVCVLNSYAAISRRNTKDKRMSRNAAKDHSPGSYHRTFADLHAVNHCCADGDPCPAPHSHFSTKMGAWPDVGPVANHALMVDTCARVDDNASTSPHPGTYHCAGTHHRSGAQRSVARNYSPWANLPEPTLGPGSREFLRGRSLSAQSPTATMALPTPCLRSLSNCS